eukprot:TRINITY_DN7689_c0_g1_i1.p1 TRINITY_DN7689_c0_g1~~TRINITY_DN7689_c0_g1_i1.p1  ORF type:complete len:220 (-),score=48.75 TRINITY_DN7689_c0_g1_i1:75-734(-)
MGGENLPEGWFKKESKSHPGRYFYYHKETKEKSWYAPGSAKIEEQVKRKAEAASLKIEQTAKASKTFVPAARPGAAGATASAPGAAGATASVYDDDEPTCHALHLLIKHADSRRPSSWREANITLSKVAARRVLAQIKREILDEAKLRGGGASAVRAVFGERAKERSDCSSYLKGGDLGHFKRGKMQRPFENAAFALAPRGLSEIVETDSGVHIIYRIA